MITIFNKTKDQHGWLGNMSAHPVKYDNKWWLTTEALFQALRFPEDSKVREIIRAEKRPMAAKMMAKKFRDLMVVKPCGPRDIENMKLMLRLKLTFNKQLKQELLATGETDIIEDCTSRSPSPWGARLVDGEWVGDNLLGKLWMEYRSELMQVTC